MGGASAFAAAPENIAVFTKNSVNPNYQAFFLGTQRAAAALGATVEWRAPHKPDDAAEQTVLLNQTTALHPDAIVFAPADDRAMEEPVAAAAHAGIPIVGYINRMRGAFVSFIGSDDVANGRAEADYLIRALGRQGAVAIITGPSTAPTGRDRLKGYLSAVAETPGIRVVETIAGNYLRDGGMAAMQHLLEGHPRIDGVIAANDLMALGAIEAMEAAGRMAPIVGNNGSIDAAAAVGAGKMLATIDYDGFKMGCLAATAAIRAARGLAIPAEVMLRSQIIDNTNYKGWLVPIEPRTCPRWEDYVGS